MLDGIEQLTKKNSYLRRCYVPHCKNNSSNTRKLFVKLPDDPEAKKSWYDKVGTFKYTCAKEYCCEDHFDLKTDADNYATLSASPYHCEVVLKKAVLPHKNLKGDVAKQDATMRKRLQPQQPHRLIQNCETCEREGKSPNIHVTYCNEYINFNEYFAENEDVASDECDSCCEDFPTDYLFMTERTFSEQTLNLKSVSEIDMATSPLYFPCKNLLSGRHFAN